MRIDNNNQFNKITRLMLGLKWLLTLLGPVSKMSLMLIRGPTQTEKPKKEKEPSISTAVTKSQTKHGSSYFEIFLRDMEL